MRIHNPQNSKGQALATELYVQKAIQDEVTSGGEITIEDTVEKDSPFAVSGDAVYKHVNAKVSAHAENETIHTTEEDKAQIAKIEGIDTRLAAVEAGDIELDETVTADSTNGVQSSGIHSFVQSEINDAKEAINVEITETNEALSGIGGRVGEAETKLNALYPLCETIGSQDFDQTKPPTASAVMNYVTRNLPDTNVNAVMNVLYSHASNYAGGSPQPDLPRDLVHVTREQLEDVKNLTVIDEDVTEIGETVGDGTGSARVIIFNRDSVCNLTNLNRIVIPVPSSHNGTSSFTTYVQLGIIRNNGTLDVLELTDKLDAVSSNSQSVKANTTLTFDFEEGINLAELLGEDETLVLFFIANNEVKVVSEDLGKLITAPIQTKCPSRCGMFGTSTGGDNLLFFDKWIDQKWQFKIKFVEVGESHKVIDLIKERLTALESSSGDSSIDEEQVQQIIGEVLTGYVRSEDIDSLIANWIGESSVITGDNISEKVDEVLGTKDFVTSDELEVYAIKSEVDEVYAKKSEIPDVPSIDGLATTEYVDEKFESIVIPEIPELPENIVTSDELSEAISGFVTGEDVDTKISEALENIDTCDCEPVDISGIEETLYDKVEAFAKNASFDGERAENLAGFRINPALGYLPSTIKSIILKDVQNSATLETPLVINYNGNTTKPVYSWNEGDDVEFVFEKLIYTDALDDLQIMFVPNANNAVGNNLPKVKIDTNTTLSNYFACHFGSTPWGRDWRSYAPNISFRSCGLESRIKDLENDISSAVNEVIDTAIDERGLVTNENISDRINEALANNETITDAIGAALENADFVTNEALETRLEQLDVPEVDNTKVTELEERVGAIEDDYAKKSELPENIASVESVEAVDTKFEDYATKAEIEDFVNSEEVEKIIEELDKEVRVSTASEDEIDSYANTTFAIFDRKYTDNVKCLTSISLKTGQVGGDSKKKYIHVLAYDIENKKPVKWLGVSNENVGFGNNKKISFTFNGINLADIDDNLNIAIASHSSQDEPDLDATWKSTANLSTTELEELEGVGVVDVTSGDKSCTKNYLEDDYRQRLVVLDFITIDRISSIEHVADTATSNLRKHVSDKDVHFTKDEILEEIKDLQGDYVTHSEIRHSLITTHSHGDVSEDSYNYKGYKIEIKTGESYSLPRNAKIKSITLYPSTDPSPNFSGWSGGDISIEVNGVKSTNTQILDRSSSSHAELGFVPLTWYFDELVTDERESDSIVFYQYAGNNRAWAACKFDNTINDGVSRFIDGNNVNEGTPLRPLSGVPFYDVEYVDGNQTVASTNYVDEAISNSGFVTDEEVDAKISEALVSDSACECEPVDLTRIENTLYYGKPVLIGGADTFNGSYNIPFAAFEIGSFAGNVPAKIKSFIIHDVQNSATLEEPLVVIATCTISQDTTYNVSSNAIYSWNEGDDLEIVFDEEIDTTTLSRLNVKLTDNANTVADLDKLPLVKLDADRPCPWLTIAKGINTGSGAWTGEWKNYTPNISFRYNGLEERVEALEPIKDKAEQAIDILTKEQQTISYTTCPDATGAASSKAAEIPYEVISQVDCLTSLEIAITSNNNRNEVCWCQLKEWDGTDFVGDFNAISLNSQTYTDGNPSVIYKFDRIDLSSAIHEGNKLLVMYIKDESNPVETIEEAKGDVKVSQVRGVYATGTAANGNSIIFNNGFTNNYYQKMTFVNSVISDNKLDNHINDSSIHVSEDEKAAIATIDSKASIESVSSLQTTVDGYESRIAALEAGADNSDGVSEERVEEIITSKDFATQTQLSSKADSSKLEELEQTVQTLQLLVEGLQGELNSTKLENIALKTWVEENFIKGAVISKDELAEETSED